VIARLTAAYLAIFALVLALLSAGAYFFVAGQYHSLLLPALGTPEGQTAYGVALHHVLVTIASFDVPLLVLVGLASAGLAKLSLRPLLLAQERQRRFVADAAHELRSPLATIASVAQATRGTSAEPATIRALELITQTSLDASALIADLLTLAREPEGRLLAREPIDLASVAHACIREFEPRAKDAGLALSATIESAIVDGDERRLRELVRNLLENALRHARTTIELRCETVPGNACVIVSDDGEGVDAEHRQRIFERFAESNSASGTGLGLSIARWVAQAHDGTLVLDERAAAGAMFVFTIPLLRPS